VTLGEVSRLIGLWKDWLAKLGLQKRERIGIEQTFAKHYEDGPESPQMPPQLV